MEIVDRRTRQAQKVFESLGEPSELKEIACKLRYFWTLTLSIAGWQTKRLARYAPLEVQSMFIIPSPSCLGLRTLLPLAGVQGITQYMV